MTINPWTASGFGFYLIVGFVMSPIWMPFLMIYLVTFMAWMLVYSLIWSPAKWLYAVSSHQFSREKS